MKPTQPATVSSEFPGTDSSAVKHQSTSKTQTYQPGSSERTGTNFSAAKHQSTSKLQSGRPHTDQPKSSDPTGTDSPVLHRSRKYSISSLSSEADSQDSDRPPLDLYVEEGELSEDQDITVTEQDQSISEEQTYRETMRGICSFMGWSHVSDMDSSTNTSDDNPFAGPKAAVPGKVSVQMPTEDWLCRKLSKLNVILVEGYPSCSLEAGGLLNRPD